MQDAQLAQQLRTKDAARLSSLTAQLAAKADESSALAASLAEEQRQLKSAQASAAELRKQLDEGTQSLDQAKHRLEELRRAQAAAEQRAALFRNLALKLRKMVDAGELKIALRDGHLGATASGEDRAKRYLPLEAALVDALIAITAKTRPTRMVRAALAEECRA